MSHEIIPSILWRVESRLEAMRELDPPKQDMSVGLLADIAFAIKFLQAECETMSAGQCIVENGILAGEGGHFYCSQKDELARLRAENARLHTRLEDNFCFDAKGNRNDVEPGSIPDGIACRDETIRVQDAEITALRHDIERQVQAASDLANDAARYQRIREHGIPCSCGDDCGAPSGGELDEAVDHALKEGAAK